MTTLRTFTFTEPELQKVLNDNKDSVIEHLNDEHDTDINPASVLVLLHSRGCLGRVWDKICGKSEETNAVSHVVTIKNPPIAEDKHDSPTSAAHAPRY